MSVRRGAGPGTSRAGVPHYDAAVVNLLLSVTFACGLVIAGLHVINRRFIAPIYDIVLNLIAFVSATATSLLLGEWQPACFSAAAVLAWIWLALRTYRASRAGIARTGQQVG